MKLRHLAAVLMAATLVTATSLVIPTPEGWASGFWPNLPAATSPGTAPTTEAPSTATGQTIGANDCIPMDTGNASGINPSTMCVSPSQIVGYVGNTGQSLLKYTNIPIGSVAYGSLGTNTTPVAGTIYYSQLNLMAAITITNIGCLNGGTVGTDKAIYALYNSSGTLVANTALAGVTTSGTDAFQEIALTATYAAVPGTYFVAWQTNGTTTRFRTIAASTYISWATGSQTGTFATLAAITPPTSFTADKGPICYVN